MGFLGVLGISFTSRERVGLRQGLLYGTGLLMGASIAPLLSVVSPGTIVMAFAGTAAIFAGFSVAALRAKSDTFIKLGGPLLGGLFLLVRVPEPRHSDSVTFNSLYI
jgi:FtsH-binding integral membrane protein